LPERGGATILSPSFMAELQPVPAEEPRILEAETPAWLSAKVIVPVVLAVAAGVGLVLWQVSKAEKTKNEAAKLLASDSTPETWEKLIRDYPSQPATALAILNAAEDASSKKDHRKSAELYQKFAQEFPKHPLLSAARLGQANQLALAGDGAAAQSLYLRIVTERPPDAFQTAAAVGLARIQIQENRPEAARQVLNDVLAQNNGSAFLPEARAMLDKLPPPPSTAASLSAPMPAPQPPAK
jgi:predicted negative regulator of RcsB-dependent stress response